MLHVLGIFSGIKLRMLVYVYVQGMLLYFYVKRAMLVYVYVKLGMLLERAEDVQGMLVYVFVKRVVLCLRSGWESRGRRGGA